MDTKKIGWTPANLLEIIDNCNKYLEQFLKAFSIKPLKQSQSHREQNQVHHLNFSYWAIFKVIKLIK